MTSSTAAEVASTISVRHGVKDICVRNSSLIVVVYDLDIQRFQGASNVSSHFYIICSFWHCSQSLLYNNTLIIAIILLVHFACQVSQTLTMHLSLLCLHLSQDLDIFIILSTGMASQILTHPLARWRCSRSNDTWSYFSKTNLPTYARLSDYFSRDLALHL